MISEALIKNQSAKITFVMVDALYTEVPGLLGTFNLSISKNGGLFAASTGAKGEIGNGWYYYDLTAAETNTVGPLSIKITGVGCIQQNLEYVVEWRNGGVCPFTYTLINSVTLLPIPDAQIWIYTDVTLTNVVWYGITDIFGIPHDSQGDLPYLDPGIYYLKRHKGGFSFTDPDIETISCSPIIVAKDSGPLGLDGIYHQATLGGSVNRAWFSSPIATFSYVDIYSPTFAALWDGDEFTAIIRCKVNSLSDYSGGLREILALYSFPFGNDVTLDIPLAGSALETTYMNSGFPPNLTRTVASLDLGWNTLGIRASHLAGTYFFDLNGVQQGASVGNPLWNGVLGANYTRLGDPFWHGWLADCIISLNGAVATSPQMLSIHNKLVANTLTTADLDTIFGLNNYVWYRLDESP